MKCDFFKKGKAKDTLALVTTIVTSHMEVKGVLFCSILFLSASGLSCGMQAPRCGIQTSF